MRTCQECGREEQGHGELRLRWHLVDGTLVDGQPVSHDFCTARCLADYANREVAAEQRHETQGL
jgi:hypothetical protein